MTDPTRQGEISPDQFLKFRDFFYRKTGIFFEENKRYFVDKRLIERIKATESNSFREYFTSVRFETDGRELQNLINLMTVNESYFYREIYQLECLVRSILPELIRTGDYGKARPVRIWSIPCSTGEEPYSIALYLLENWDGLADYDVEIMASDIDTKVLASARKGEYELRAVSHLPMRVLKKHFIDMGSNRYIIKKELREIITFCRINIINYQEMGRYRDIDIVFCRNLLLYFDETSRRIAAEGLFDVLRPGGFVCLGHSESMSRITPLFLPRKFAEAIVYQKPF